MINIISYLKSRFSWTGAEKDAELSVKALVAGYNGDTVAFVADLIALLEEFKSQLTAALPAVPPTTVPVPPVVPVSPTVLPKA